jgi:hypothetical protein
MRVTVMLTARSDGFKCMPFVLLSRKRPIPNVVNKFKGKLNLSWAGKIWMDDDLIKEYLNTTFGQFCFGERLLVWDSFRAHISKSTKAELKKMQIDTAVVPGGCTKFIQMNFIILIGILK